MLSEAIQTMKPAFDLVGGLTADVKNLILPSYDVGTDFVPRTGPAIVHRGERIVPAHENTGGAGPMTVYLRLDAAAVRQIMREEADYVRIEAEWHNAGSRRVVY